MHDDYKGWLAARGYADTTQTAQLHRVQKVEEQYGALDGLIEAGAFPAVIAELTYSVADERQNRPNPSRLAFQGNIRTNLQSYKNAAIRYARFLAEMAGPLHDADGHSAAPAESAPDDAKQRLALERDMQTALRRDIAALEPGLEIIDDGAEHSVASGFVDILCRDRDKRIVVVELKAGKTDARVVGQILGYMGDLMESEDTQDIRGIIVAHDFDKRTLSAARAIPNLRLVAYSIAFQFQDIT